MFRDTKVNYLQHTQAKLQKMAARFLLLEPDQILVQEEDIPNTVQEMMATNHDTSSGNSDNSGSDNSGSD
jgi:hypothetical protein